MTGKQVPLERCLEGVRSGMTIMVGGFGVPGTPMTLVEALYDKGVSGLTLIKNEANEPGMGVSRLIEAGRVERIILTHLGLNSVVIDMMNRGEVAVNFFPQGILAEKIRCGGAGLAAFLTDIGLETIVRQNKAVVEVNGQEFIVEPALRADVALIHAHKADTLGNLSYRGTASNFNPLMAQAASLVIAEAVHVTEPGGLDPDCVHTPAAFVDRVVDLGGKGYGILEHHVAQG